MGLSVLKEGFSEFLNDIDYNERFENTVIKLIANLTFFAKKP